MDGYLLSRTIGPMAAVVGSAMLAFLMERVLRALDQMSQTRNELSYVAQLLVNLAPHYVGLVLPAGFFIALFVVVDRLNDQSEIDAMLASGMSLSRIASPFVALGLVLMLLSLLLYGFIQPYSRYAYRAVLNAANNAGWDGEVQAQTILSPDGGFILTADAVDPTGQRLRRIFIRRRAADGGEDVLTAPAAEIHRNRDGQSVTLDLGGGQQVSRTAGGAVRMLTFSDLSLQLPLAPSAKLFRARGQGEETELTLIELARLGYGGEPPALPRQTLLAELYSRLARAVVLPLMPLLAVPLALTAKRAGPRAASAMAGVLLFAFQTSLVFGQALAAKGLASAAHAEGWPFGVFAAACLLTFASSRKTPGEGPVDKVADLVSDGFRFLSGRRDALLGRP